MLLSMCREGSRTSKLLSMGVPQPETLRARLVLTSETEQGAGEWWPRWGLLQWPLRLAAGRTACHQPPDIFCGSDCRSCVRWKGPREMPQEAHATGKKRKLCTDHQAKATARKVVVSGRTPRLLITC